MAKTGAFWDSSPTDFEGSIKASVYKKTRDSAIALFNNCVALSPVDSGAYRASWLISEGEPEFKWVGRQPRNATELPPPSAPPHLSTKFYRSFFVTNGAPYAMKLEYGWSEQAPQGIMRQALKWV